MDGKVVHVKVVKRGQACLGVENVADRAANSATHMVVRACVTIKTFLLACLLK